jgi:hypothetical protein
MTARALPIKRLRRLCGMFGSDHDGERASAARLADRLIREHGLTWDDVLVEPPPTPAREPRPPLMAWRAACERILTKGCLPWERKFCQNLLANWRGPLTEKQAVCLDRIYMCCVACYERRRA